MLRLTAQSYVQSGNVIGNAYNEGTAAQSSVPQTNGCNSLCELASQTLSPPE